MINREGLRLRLQGAPDRRTFAPNREGRDGSLDRPALRSPGLSAAVLIGIVGYSEGPRIILTVRTTHLREHAGEISLPGGRIEASDASPEEAALREAREEINIDPSRVDLLGRLHPYDTVTGFHVHPVVGWIEPPVTYSLDPFEVAEVFELPLAFVLDSGNRQEGHIEAGGRTTRFYVLQYKDRRIWGATAGILVNFARVLDRCA